MRKKGQILVAMPVLVIFMIGAILLSINIGIFTKERIKMQVAADVASRDGALVQASSLMAIAVINDAIIYQYGKMVSIIIKYAKWLWFPPVLAYVIARCIEIAEKIKKLQKTADTIKTGTPAAVEAAVVLGATTNGASLGTCKFSKESWDGVNLDLEWSFGFGDFGKWLSWILGHITGLKGCLLRKDGTVSEKVMVEVWKNSGSAYGRGILGKLTFPQITTYSMAKPYWIGYILEKRDPRDDNMNWFDQMTSMTVPTSWWDAKLATEQ